MYKFLTLTRSSALLAGILFISACGGGGGEDSGGTAGITFDGNTSPAAIDATNAEAIGTAAGESVEKAASSDGLSALPVAFDGSADLDTINNIVLAIVNHASLPAGIDLSDQYCTSGSASSTDPGNTQSGPLDITITFSNCALIYDPFTLDGVVYAHFDDISNLNSFTFSYQNFKVTDASGHTTTINMTLSCTDSFNCTYNSDFVGSNGITHRVTDFNISGDRDTGFSGSATFYHGTFGSVSITFSGITYGNCGSLPDGGTIDYESTDGSSGTITFNSDCTTSGTWTDSNSHFGSWPNPVT